MAGHSKWSQIKRKKGLKDVQKGAIFAKLSRNIMLAVSEGGGVLDPDLNLKLRLAVEKAKQNNMPKDTIQGVIEKASGQGRSQLKQLYYEAFGPGGSMLYIETLTDNEKRAISDVKSVLYRHKGKLGAAGSVGYLFRHCGVVTLDKIQNTEADVVMFAERLDACDIDEDAERYIITIPFHNIGKVKDQVGELRISSQEQQFVPQTYIPVPANEKEDVIRLIEALEDLEDVHAVYTNALFSEL